MSELSLIPNSTPHLIEGDDVQQERTNEQILMSRIANGDETAIEELLARHGEMLARLVGRLTAWHADSDDILQEVILTVWQKANSYRGRGTLEGWLKRITVNRCRNYFRTLNSIQRIIERLATGLKQEATTQQTFRRSPMSDEPSELQIAIKKLSDADRAPLVLFYLEQMPGDEVARTLGIKLETLHVRLCRARKKLKKLMKQD